MNLDETSLNIKHLMPTIKIQKNTLMRIVQRILAIMINTTNHTYMLIPCTQNGRDLDKQLIDNLERSLDYSISPGLR